MFPGTQRVCDYLMQNKTITSKEAFEKLGETRLSARIYDLRKKGYVINGGYISVYNRFGAVCHVKQYEIFGVPVK